MKLNEPTVLKIRQHTVFLKKKVPEKKIMVTGDWHISPIISDRQADFLREAVDFVKPDAIILQGDIIDSPMELMRETSVEKLTCELKICSDAAPTMMVLGSHDFITPTEPAKVMKKSALSRWQVICEKCNIKLLINESYEPVEGVRFFGMFQDERCIIGLNKHGEKKHFNNVDGFLKCLEDIEANGGFEVEPEKVNWLIAHAPLLSREVLEKMKGFDIASFGHTHGGIVPRGIDEVFDRLGINTGLISTDLKPLPLFARGIKPANDNMLMIINPGMTGAQFCAPKVLQNLNFVKAAEISIVNLRAL